MWQVAAMLGSQIIGGVMQNQAAKKAAGAASAGKRNYLKEMQSALKAQAAIQPQMLNLDREYRPQWQQLEADMLSQQMGLTRGLQRDAAQGSGQAGMYLAEQMAPALKYAGMTGLDYYRQTMGDENTALMTGLRQQALADQNMGRGLSPEQQSYANQAARMAMQARGLQGSGQAVAYEVMNSEQAMQEREDARRKFALQMYGQGADELTRAQNMYGAPLTDLVQFANPKALMGLATQQQGAAGPQIAQPESEYNARIYSANSQNAMNAQLAAAQQQAGIGAGIMSMGSQLGSAYLGNPSLFAASPSTATAAATAAPAAASVDMSGLPSASLTNPWQSMVPQGLGNFSGYNPNGYGGFGMMPSMPSGGYGGFGNAPWSGGGLRGMNAYGGGMSPLSYTPSYFQVPASNYQQLLRSL